MSNKIEINIDFDGTCVTHDYPRVGADIGSVKVLKRLVDKGHKLILFTMRSEKNNSLIDAIEWFGIHEIPLYGIQSNPTQKHWTSSPKSYAPLMIDDSAIGCPLKYDPEISPRKFVDWEKVEAMLEEQGLI